MENRNKQKNWVSQYKWQNYYIPYYTYCSSLMNNISSQSSNQREGFLESHMHGAPDFALGNRIIWGRKEGHILGRRKETVLYNNKKMLLASTVADYANPTLAESAMRKIVQQDDALQISTCFQTVFQVSATLLYWQSHLLSFREQINRADRCASVKLTKDLSLISSV